MKKNRHFRRIPDYINLELSRTESRHIIVAAIIEATKVEVERDKLRYFSFDIKEGVVTYRERITPDYLDGLFARRNINGTELIRKDLPKVRKTYYCESPNFGDSSKGYHSTYWDREVYQRELEPAREWDILISIISETEDRFKFKAEISAKLDKQDLNFEKDLFFAIHLMQEQFQDCHVFDSNMSNEDIAKTTIVGWEIFPPGRLETTLSLITEKMRVKTPERQQKIQNRIEVLESLHPTEYIRGSGMNSHYFGAKFGEKVVVFENLDYGNAIYILSDNWEEISKMSRIDIMKRHEKDYIRIIHKKNWELQLLYHINSLKGGKNA